MASTAHFPHQGLDRSREHRETVGAQIEFSVFDLHVINVIRSV
jgi:hypothetical protein